MQINIRRFSRAARQSVFDVFKEQFHFNTSQPKDTIREAKNLRLAEIHFDWQNCDIVCLDPLGVAVP